MADSEVILDKDVRRIAGVRLVPRLGRPWEVHYEVIFVDGRIQQRPLSACACPEAIANFEGRYFASAHRGGLPGSRIFLPDDDDAKSESIDAASRDGSNADDRHADNLPSDTKSESTDSASSDDGSDDSDGSDADDRHLDDIPSDDSCWEYMVDSQGRSATSPTVRAAIRAKASAPDETFSTPSKEGSESEDSAEDGSSSKSPGSATTAEHRSATKSAGSTTSDSLLLELAATAGAVDISPKKRPVRPAAFRGVALRRYASELQLHALDDDDLFADDDDSDGFSPRKRMAKLKVKDEVVVKAEVEDDSMDPWGNQKAPDPWTQPAAAPGRPGVGARDRDTKGADSWHHYRPMRSYHAEAAKNRVNKPSFSQPLAKTEKELGVVGSLFAEYFASQAHNNVSSLPGKQVKAEEISDDDNDGLRGHKASTLGACRKRRLGPAAKIEVITLSDDEDETPRVPAKKSKKRTNAAIVYVLSSDSEDHLAQSKP